jgi:hypothetical protein
MLMMKAHHGWSDTSFNDLLRILAYTYPEDNKVPANTYREKKLIQLVAMKLKKFHACPNHCILYWGKYENLQSCPHYGASRYKRNASCRADADDERGPKKKKTSKKSTTKKQIPSPEDKEEEGYTQRNSPALSMWYLPVIDHLRAIFRNPKDAKLMSWHASDKCMKDDGKQWKRFNTKFLEFGDKARNIRFTLRTDGMNPFGDLSGSHSTWPIILTIYNLPPWLCQKHRYLLLTMIISRPRQPGNNKDVFLEPLMEDMKILWEDGI